MVAYFGENYVSPNPVYDILTVTSSYDLESQVCIYSLNGNLIIIKTLKDKSINIDMSNLPQDIYIIKIFNYRGSMIKKIIKK